MGVVCGKWNFAEGEPSGAEVVAEALRAATGLKVNVDKRGLRFAVLGLELPFKPWPVPSQSPLAPNTGSDNHTVLSVNLKEAVN